MKIYSLSTRVWNVIISPRDRTLKDEINMCANLNKIEMKLYDVLSEKKKPAYCCKYYLAKSVNSRNVPDEKRKLLIVFPGRNYNFFQIGNTFYTHKLYKTSKVDEFDIATIIYPEKMHNLVELVESCLSAIVQLLSNHGYSLPNVSIFGYCLGGYFATETMRRYEETNESNKTTFECFINTKSFSSVHEFLYFILPKYIRPVLKLWPIKRYVRMWNSDSARSLESFDHVFKSIYVVYADADPIVNGLSHFYKHVRGDNIEIKEDTVKSNHLCNFNLLAEILASEAKAIKKM